MFSGFFLELRAAGVPATLREYLTLLEGMKVGVAGLSVESFYHLARATMVKDERYLDRFDRVFARWFEGAQAIDDPIRKLPEDWLKAMGQRYLTDEERAQIQAMGGWSELMDLLKKRLEEQKRRHSGGSKWIGTGGTSPFGNNGYNPAGVRIGGSGGNRTAVKVWEERIFRDYDDRRELDTRDMKMALRRLRKLAREGRPDELDLEGTIDGTAKNAGWLDIKMRPERRNAVKVLLLLDVGGSMDDHVELAERLFSAARSEFKRLEAYYFHNCLYERVWRENVRRAGQSTPTHELLRTYPKNWRLVFVGDASMSPWEITEPGASVEHWNEEPGAVWMQRALDRWERAIWINPVPREGWNWSTSIRVIRDLMDGRMVPLSIEGLDEGMRMLRA